MKRFKLGKSSRVFLAVLSVSAGLDPSETRAGWFSRGSRDDCSPGTSRRRAKAESACELARAQQMSDRTCAELTAMAECDRRSANLRALANYQQVPLRMNAPR